MRNQRDIAEDHHHDNIKLYPVRRNLVKTSRLQLYVHLFFLALPFSAIGHKVPSGHAHCGMVVTENTLASQVGGAILKAGGNAIDAAIAVGYALAVVNPCCGNIGGGGFMLAHFADGRDVFINFREKAPNKAYKNMFLDKSGQLAPGVTTKDHRAVAVPGTVLGLDTALQKYGTMSRQQVMAPAIRLAQQGHVVSAYESKLYAQFAEEFRKKPNIAAIFLPHGRPPQPGERIIQAGLGKTLQAIADQGPAAFYKGLIAEKMVHAGRLQGGLLTLKDFAHYSVKESRPLYCHYKGHTIISSPPPSSGGTTLCEMLNIIETAPQVPSHSAQSIHYIVSAMQNAFVDRNSKLGDPDFVVDPIDQLVSKKYARELSKQAIFFHVPSSSSQDEFELTDTTHYSIVDTEGNAVAVTYTLNGFFGARVMAEDTGFFLNNVMDDFTVLPGVANKFGLVQSEMNSIAPGKRPLSSMTPTIVLKDNKVLLVLGSPGGPRIITAVLLVLLDLIDNGMSLKDAVNAPRYHYQVSPDLLFAELFAFPFLTRLQLALMGYTIVYQKDWGAVEAIYIDPQNTNLYGANDPRRPDGASVSVCQKKG